MPSAPHAHLPAREEPQPRVREAVTAAVTLRVVARGHPAWLRVSLPGDTDRTWVGGTGGGRGGSR